MPVYRQVGRSRWRRRHGAGRGIAGQRAGQQGGDQRHAAGVGVDQHGAGYLAQDDGHEGAHFDQAITAYQLLRFQVLRQHAELERAEQRRVDAHQQDGAHQYHAVMQPEAQCGYQHDGDFHLLDHPCDGGLVVLFAQLAGGGGKQEKRQDEQRGGQLDHQLGGQPQHLHAVKVDQHHHGVFQQVVVESTKKLGDEQRHKAPRA